jgi:3-deoxy-D-manno-octulosonate 8-phosphate phosphatase (KDO 8-P phosphatase)
VIGSIEAKGFAAARRPAHDGISLARLGGLRIGIITKRNSQTVAIRANDLKLEFVYQGQSHKMTRSRDPRQGWHHDRRAGLRRRRHRRPSRDASLRPRHRHRQRPQRSNPSCHYITPNPGGFGAGRDAIDFILTEQGVLEKVIEQYLDE